MLPLSFSGAERQPARKMNSKTASPASRQIKIRTCRITTICFQPSWVPVISLTAASKWFSNRVLIFRQYVDNLDSIPDLKASCDHDSFRPHRVTSLKAYF